METAAFQEHKSFFESQTRDAFVNGNRQYLCSTSECRAVFDPNKVPLSKRCSIRYCTEIRAAAQHVTIYFAGLTFVIKRLAAHCLAEQKCGYYGLDEILEPSCWNKDINGEAFVCWYCETKCCEQSCGSVWCRYCLHPCASVGEACCRHCSFHRDLWV